MNKILIAVDGTKASREVLSTFSALIRRPEEVVLLHVQRLQGESLMTDMLGEAEMSTLKESMEGTAHKEALDRKSWKVLDHYRGKLEGMGGFTVKTLLRGGNAAEEILKVAGEESVDLVILGKSRKKGLDRIITGNVAREVEKEVGVPVMTARRTVVCEEPYSWGDAYAAISACTIVVFGLVLLGLFT